MSLPKKRPRRTSHHPSPKMDFFFPPTQHGLLDCADQAGCRDLPVSCDDQCGQSFEDYCRACLEEPTCDADCDVAGCDMQCTDCCDATCTDGACSQLHTQTTSSPILGAPSSDNMLSYPSHFDIPVTNDDYYSYHCHWNHCDFSFSSFFDFDEHLLDSHIPQAEAPIAPIQTMFQCQWDECQTTAPTETDLVKHVKRDHLPTSSKEHHQCLWVHQDGNVCNLCCPSAEELSSHLENDHLGSGKGSYTCHWENCQRCQKPFPQRQKAIRHIRTHTGLKAFKCSFCAKTFATQEILAQHTRLHTKSRPYPCTICDKRFTTSSALLVHSRVHSGEKPLECKICGKRFGESSNLRKHERVHEGRKEFVCQHEGCGKRFLRLDQLKRHGRVHG